MNILVVAPHADDEIIGVGGTIAKHISMGNKVYVCTVTKGVKPLFNDDIVNKIYQETIEYPKFLGISQALFLGYPSVMLETVSRYEINNKLLEMIQTIEQLKYLFHIIKS